MPPLATTQAGLAGSAPGGVKDGGDVELDLGQAAATPGDRNLPAGQADVRPDDDERTAAHAGQDLGHPRRPAQADVVEASAGRLAANGVQPAHLGDDVPAQRRVAAADHADGRAQPAGQVEQHPPDPGGQLHRVGLGQAAGVGQDEAGRARLERPAASSSGSTTVTRSTPWTVWNPVGSSSRTAIRRPAPARARRIRRRASGSTRAGGRSAVGFVLVIADRQETWRPPLMS